jgi:uncharacterized protein
VAVKAQRCLGIYCSVNSNGPLRVGDDVALRRATAPRQLLSDAARRTKRLALGAVTAAADRLSR